MKIHKFGGTSVGSASRIKNVAQIVISEKGEKIVVLSAMSGTTNDLLKFSALLSEKNTTEAFGLLNSLAGHYRQVADELFGSVYHKNKALAVINEHFDELFAISGEITEDTEKQIVAKGELLSTSLFYAYLLEIGIKAAWLPALSFLRIDKYEEPDDFYIRENLERLVLKQTGVEVFVTQGFICKDKEGKISNLKRGGSDYSASIIGAAVGASEIVIWTDIDGLHNNDPRFVKNTHPVSHLSYDEASVLALNGAKILHPLTLLPAKKANIPVRIKNSFAPNSFGTVITNQKEGFGAKAIAAKDDVTAFRLLPGEIGSETDSLSRLLEISRKHKAKIDLLTGTEIALSLINNKEQANEALTTEFNKYVKTEIHQNQSIICVVGDFAENHSITAKILMALHNIPIRNISLDQFQNVSILVSSDYKKEALNCLNNVLF
jgi:aspartate kinase